MRIEELVIEGFKSYPVRTQITGWDPSFNAITGLNGSGKSNILDAICFVLGITNMSTMRAANQQDLIYKRGQAGVTRASVTIVFDNSDRSRSPVGFEDCKQITVTRQIALPNVTKYLLNGHKSQQQNVQTLFQSVQLNINNPNFVIMQGRITKVLNMRPQEILGMVEEAAGTRMFEDRKDKAVKTMSKKDTKIREISEILLSEITPKLNKLRKEKSSFLAWQKSVTELERTGRVLRAWEWVEAGERIERKAEEMQGREEEKRGVEGVKKRAVKSLGKAEREMAAVVAKREQEMKKGGKLKKLQEEVAELGKHGVKLRTQAELKEGTIRDEEGNVKDLEKEVKNLEASYKEKQREVEKLNRAYGELQQKHHAATSTLTSKEELLQTLLTGLSGNSKNSNAGGGGYMGQIADARQRIAQASTEEEQARVKIGMNEKELAGLVKRWKEVEREAGDGKQKLDGMQREVEAIKKKIERCGWDEAKEREGEAKMRELKGRVQELTMKLEAARQSISNLDFQYDAPYPQFDRKKVKGRAGLLVTLEERNYKAATALEIAAGGKLFNVVVEDEKVGKDLLQPGKLKKRVTIIPLNKINAFSITAQKLAAAERVAPGQVRTALSLVGYTKDVAAAMAFVFSDTLICDDAGVAQKVTFHADVHTRSVTLAGDVYDPSGTLTGGASPSGSGVLIKVQQFLEVEGQLREVKRKLEGVEREMGGGGGGREEWKKLKRDLDLKEHAVKLLHDQIEASSASRIRAQIEELKEKIEELKTTGQAAGERQKEAKAECAKLERDMAEFKNNKEGKIDELKSEITRQKSEVQKSQKIVKENGKKVQTAKLELEQDQTDIGTAQQNLEDAKAGIEKLKKELDELREQVADHEAEYVSAEAKLIEERAELSRFDEEIKDLEVHIKQLKTEISDADLNLQKLDHEMVAMEREKSNASSFMAGLERQFEWIKEDKDKFGKEGTMYDFRSMDVNQLRTRAEELETSQRGLKKKINPKVMSMIENVEKREASLRKMLGTVLKDREKIEQTIKELDRYKRDALQRTWEKVDADFGGIFSELLPGNFARLQPPEGQDLMDGLEVKVQLGNVWKQSLTELSGGQRSLIALSLIMALLQFKPAPMYILDEIDAALDLSHTQHIGQLFRTRFKGSQFIVVSLKEGLFLNANVLFKARFRDGTSVVDRAAQRSPGEREEENESQGRVVRRGGRS